MFKKHRSGGFTLVELLVVIAIIGILVALLLPAIQAAREAARRTQCTNNLKQLGVALHNYHDAHKVLPAAAYCTSANTIAHCHTWLATLLPFIEQQAWHDQINFNAWNHQGGNPAVLNDVVVGSLLCPSDPDSGLYPNSREMGYTPCVTCAAGDTSQSMGANYVPCAGPLHMNTCPVPAMTPNINCQSTAGARLDVEAPGMFNGGRISRNFANCRDGTSNTFLLGETLPIYSTFHMYFASHMHIGTSNPPPNYHKIYATSCPKSRTSRVDTCYAHMGGFMSQHPGGLHMILTDASVRFVADAIDYTTWCYLGDRTDGKAVGDY